MTIAETNRRASSAVAAVVVVLTLALAALMVFPSLADSGVTDTGTQGTTQPAAVTPTGEVTEVEVTVEGMSFVPGVIEVPLGNTLVVTLTNTGDQRHDLMFTNGALIEPIAPGASATVEVGVITSDMEGWCTLPGHRQMGMVLEVVAIGGSTDAQAGDGTDHAMPGHSMNMSSTSSDTAVPTMDQLIAQAATIDPYPARLPELGEESHHEYTFEVTEDEQDLAAGVVRAVWTYNGSAPGPTLHGRVGDTFKITLVNKGTMGHSIDFHAGIVAPDEVMRTIEPGESLVYEFTAPRSGIWMYHCSTMPMATHIQQGMFGAVIIEPDGLEPVDEQYVLIQSDIYLDENFADGDLVPELTAFNGRPFQYDAHPLTARVNDRVRVWVLDVGPNSALSFHIVGTQFDTVWSEGGYSVYHDQSTDGITKGSTGAQVLPLLAAQGGFVEFVPVEAGTYTFVNHIMSLAERGAHGIFKVTD
ncbi:multicopper oxidase domain-containing protein [Actinomyces minihominis]|uniref:multicopper oxidase domain-containing protein n=1 Tax=Actinomyces minihominis TaxID=2002838 RepID=UPI000C084915|nr:multicopper oxidase domain-containing protein [Actinomyces minihominis]